MTALRSGGCNGPPSHPAVYISAAEASPGRLLVASRPLIAASHTVVVKLPSSTMRLLVVLCLCWAAVDATYFQDCGSTATVTEFTVEGCDIPPCILPRGETLEVSFVFDASAYSETLTIDTTATIGGIDFPWEGIDTDGCHFTTCPFNAGDTVSFTMPVEVLTEYPAISVVVTWKLVDDAGDSQVCAMLPATLI